MRQTNGQEQGGERRQQRKTNGKKRGGERLAPRFANAVAAHTEENGGAVGEEEGLERRAEAVEHVRELLLTPTTRCFVVKSFSDANLHKSLKYGVWTSTYAHNAALDQAFNSDLAAVRPILLFFSVCNTKHFSGIARMTSRVRSGVRFELWEKPKYEGIFHIEWLLVKDVPNYVLTDIKMSNTPTKRSITSCRDCEEVMFEEASRFISVFTQFPSRTSAWDDFDHFDRHQESVLEPKRGLAPADRGDVASFLTLV